MAQPGRGPFTELVSGSVHLAKSHDGIFQRAAWPRPALAEYTGGIYQGRSDNPVGPTVSPYLNLLQSTNQLNGISNYQSLVRPLLDQQSAIQVTAIQFRSCSGKPRPA